MTESTDRSQAWKSEAEVDIPLDGGRVVTVLKPDAQVFVNAGMDPLCFNVMVPEKKRGQKLRAELEKIQKEGDDRLHQFMTDILAATMVNPKLWTGDHTETPAGHVHVRHLGQDAEIVFIHVFKMAGFLTAEATADAVRKFRPDTNGETGQPDGGNVGGETIGDPEIKPD
jgi:hypothetical protein